MAFKITDDCINCGVCEVECLFGAILPGGVNWRNKYDELFMFNDVRPVKDPYYSNNRYYIVPEICTECQEYYSEPRCVMVCPMECIVQDNNSPLSVRSVINKETIFNTISDFIKVN